MTQRTNAHVTPEERLHEILQTVAEAFEAEQMPSALALAEQALAYAERKLGPDHALVAAPLLALCKICNDLRQYARAEAYAKRAMRGLIDSNQTDTLQARLLRACLVIAMAWQGKRDGVMQMCELAFNDLRQDLATPNSPAPELINGMAMAILTIDEYDASERMMQALIAAIRSGVLDSSIPLHAALHNYGITLLHANKPQRALTYLEQACREASRDPATGVEYIVKLRILCADAAALCEDKASCTTHVQQGYALATLFSDKISKETHQTITKMAEVFELRPATLRGAS